MVVVCVAHVLVICKLCCFSAHIIKENWWLLWCVLHMCWWSAGFAVSVHTLLERVDYLWVFFISRKQKTNYMCVSSSGNSGHLPPLADSSKSLLYFFHAWHKYTCSYQCTTMITLNTLTNSASSMHSLKFSRDWFGALMNSSKRLGNSHLHNKAT